MEARRKGREKKRILLGNKRKRGETEREREREREMY